MAQTFAEKLFSRKNLTGDLAYAGDVVEAKIDGAMLHYHANEPLYDMARPTSAYTFFKTGG